MNIYINNNKYMNIYIFILNNIFYLNEFKVGGTNTFS